jgi:hypothetical protein
MCCTSDQGCGVTRPDWIGQSNGTYQGRQHVATPNYKGEADAWEASGLQPNYYFQTTSESNPAPVELAQIPDDTQFFDPTTFVAAAQPSALFQVPSYCEPKCPALSTCSLASHEEHRKHLL